MTDRYAVIGNPISHSKSPLIHRLFAAQTGQNIHYEAVEAPLAGFAETIARLRHEGYRGCNVTVPFKLEAWQLSNQLSPRAQLAEAVNTLIFQADGIHGDNTDGAGLVRDIERNLGCDLQHKKILLLGAGGAAQGVLHPLLNTQPALLVISNRTLDKAINLKNKAQQFPAFAEIDIRAETFSGLTHAFDVVINATSAGLSDSAIPLPSTIFAPHALAYDMMYGRETPFLKFAREHGARTADGLGMLVEQAAESFEIWRGVAPNSQAVLKHLRQQ